MAQSHIAGETYTVYKEKWQKNANTGQQEKIQVPKKVSPWLYKRNNQYFFEVRYGNKPLELSKGNHAIEVGEQESLVPTIETVNQDMKCMRCCCHVETFGIPFDKHAYYSGS